MLGSRLETGKVNPKVLTGGVSVGNNLSMALKQHALQQIRGLGSMLVSCLMLLNVLPAEQPQLLNGHHHLRRSATCARCLLEGCWAGGKLIVYLEAQAECSSRLHGWWTWKLAQEQTGALCRPSRGVAGGKRAPVQQQILSMGKPCRHLMMGSQALLACRGVL